MQCSTRNFLASQALYGIMIAYPRMSEDQMIDKAQRIANKMLKYKRKPPQEIQYATHRDGNKNRR